jgi:hypothetical protein
MTSPEQIGRYEVLSELGGGAMGMVFLARDTLLKREVALKTFHRPGAESDEEYENQRKRLLREARSAASLSHPNVVGIYDVIDLDAEGGVFIAMEYVPGTSLEKRLERGPLPAHETVRLLGQMAEALDYVHQRGFVHRDIKPSNVLIDRDEQVKLADFGIALPEPLDDTLETTVFGTPQYMAPEQILGNAMDARTDVFALGVLVFEMLTGEKPFGGATVPEVARNILSGQVVPAVGRIPFGLGAVLRRSLAMRPEDRYPTAGEFALAVREALRADPDSTLVSGPIATARPAAPARRRPLALALVAGAVLLALGAALVSRRMLAEAETGARAAGYAHVMAEAQGQIDAGDPEAAALLFATATRLADDPREAQNLREAALRRAAQIEDERVAQAAAAALGAVEEDGDRTAAAGQSDRERSSAVRRAAARPQPQATAETPAPEAAPVAPPAGPAVLMVDIVSVAPAGPVVLYRDDRQILRQPFDFYERHSWFRKIPTGGHLRQEISLEPGRMTLRVLLARRDQPGVMTELPVALAAGARGQLSLRLPASGKPLVRLDSGRPAPPTPSPEP